jgi:hypothetical protein
MGHADTGRRVPAAHVEQAGVSSRLDVQSARWRSRFRSASGPAPVRVIFWTKRAGAAIWVENRLRMGLGEPLEPTRCVDGSIWASSNWTRRARHLANLVALPPHLDRQDGGGGVMRPGEVSLAHATLATSRTLVTGCIHPSSDRVGIGDHDCGDAQRSGHCPDSFRSRAIARCHPPWRGRLGSGRKSGGGIRAVHAGRRRNGGRGVRS